MKISWRTEIPSLVILTVMFALGAASWRVAPDTLPVHWSWNGQPDRFGGRFEGLFGLPLIATFTYILLLALPRIDPRRSHYATFLRPFRAVRTALIVFLFALQSLLLAWIRGWEGNMNTLVPAGAGVLLLVLGNYLPKIQSNWFVGGRTPWTLSSEFSWRRTHRLAGWLLVAGGASSVLAAAIWPTIAPKVLMSTVVTVAVVSVIYSYFACRHDPARALHADGRHVWSQDDRRER